MILEMNLSTFTAVHVALSLMGIAAGLVVALRMIAGRLPSALTAFFLATTALTSLTGFLFPFKGITPGIVVGILSMIALLIAAIALYGFHLSGAWRGTWVVSAMIALYLNFFVLIVQSFEKVPALHALAPTQKEGPFKLAQVVALLVFITLTVLAMRKFTGRAVQAA